ncbi:hypothetical protein AS25_08420 [Kocuria marina]|uniref:AAA domain-containing protein n=1 Tax=Kocuria marina TaxID=223184 RepID=A0A0B0DBM7_9MICC|nr:ParA family protein [Kocuria marina]KHE74185.1 hypothetical protein AS25_08420 [Kocuria marina]
MIVTVGNNKGGVGKTGVLTQLAAALVRAGHNVLVVDLDPQGNASRQLGWTDDHESPAPTIGDALRDATKGIAVDALVKAADLSSGFGADLLPSRVDLENRINEAAKIGAAMRLKKVLAGWTDDYDVVLIDTPPSLGHLTQMALAASDVAVGVTQPEFDSIEAVTRFRSFVEEHAEDLANPELRSAGVIVNLYKKINEHSYQLEGLQDLVGPGEILDPIIPERSVIKEAAAAAASLAEYKTPAGRQMTGLFDQLAISFTDKIGAAK